MCATPAPRQAPNKTAQFDVANRATANPEPRQIDRAIREARHGTCRRGKAFDGLSERGDTTVREG